MKKEIKIGGQIFPTKCPDKCLQKFEPFYQGNLCSRCPIFNCVSNDPNDYFVLVEPEDYREDWAKEWKRWFDDGMKGRILLKF